jgi:hypothetical protein
LILDPVTTISSTASDSSSSAEKILEEPTDKRPIIAKPKVDFVHRVVALFIRISPNFYKKVPLIET